MAREESAEISNDARFEQATDWFLRRRGDLTPIELLQWEQWYAYPENREALELIQREYDSSESGGEWLQNRSKRHSRNRFWFFGLIACVVSLGILAVVLFLRARGRAL